MITIEIDGEQQSACAEDIAEWVHRRLGRDTVNGAAKCVRVSFRAQGDGMTLSTAACGGGGSGKPDAAQQRVVNHWKELGLHQPVFAVGRLLEFLHWARRR